MGEKRIYIRALFGTPYLYVHYLRISNIRIIRVRFCPSIDVRDRISVADAFKQVEK